MLLVVKTPAHVPVTDVRVVVIEQITLCAQQSTLLTAASCTCMLGDKIAELGCALRRVSDIGCY